MTRGLPPDPHAALVAGALALGLDLTVATQDALLRYLALLQKWNRVYNLTAVRDPAAMLTHHLLDSLAALPPLRRLLQQRGVNPERPLRVLDVGSGAGLPGVVLAALSPQWQVDCVDAVGKKAAFVQQVAGELGLANVRGVHARVESLPVADARFSYDLITARAFATLRELVNLTEPLLADRGVWLAFKGKPPVDEIAALPADVRVFHVEPLQVPGMDATRCLVALERSVHTLLRDVLQH